MLKQRIITALLLLLLIGGLVFLLPPVGFVLLALAVFALAAWEWSQLAGFNTTLHRVGYALVTVVLLSIIVFFSGLPDQPQAGVLKGVFTVAGVWWAVALLWVQSYPASSRLWQTGAARSVIGWLVLVPCCIALIWLRVLEPYIWLLLYLVALVAAADVGAYFSGKAFGKTKLAPAVSPGKSWAGVVGGLLSAIALATIILWMFDVPLSALRWLIISALVALSSVLGDLLESMLKRHSGVKDSSNLLPGHGGVLDRMDGWTAAAPIFALALLSTGWNL